MPSLDSEIDTKYFDNYEEEEPWWLPENEQQKNIGFSQDNYEDFLFFDFTMKKKLCEEKKNFVI